MRISDWSSDVCSSDLAASQRAAYVAGGRDYGPRHGPFASVEELQMVLGMTPALYRLVAPAVTIWGGSASPDPNTAPPLALRSEEHTSELQSLMRSSYAVFCLKKTIAATIRPYRSDSRGSQRASYPCCVTRCTHHVVTYASRTWREMRASHG